MKLVLYMPFRQLHLAHPCLTEVRRGANPRRTDRNFLRLVITVFTLSVIMTTGIAFTQDESAQALAERSAIVVRGKDLKTNASEKTLVAASSVMAVISVNEIYAGSEITGDQKGRIATVILSRSESVKVGAELFFFGNPRFLGRSLTIADEGEISSKAAAPQNLTFLERGVQNRKDQPVLGQLAAASRVFRGTVETVRPLYDAGESKRSPALSSEHDPEWHVATVRVVTALRGDEAGRNRDFPGKPPYVYVVEVGDTNAWSQGPPDTQNGSNKAHPQSRRLPPGQQSA